MRRSVTHRMPAALVTAVVVAGCVGGTPNGTDPGKKGPLTYQQKVKKVDNLTRALSLEKNDGLKRASESIQKLVQALAGLGSSPASTPVSEVGPMRYELNRALQGVTDGAAEAVYSLTGEHKQGDTTIVYDDVTKEVTGVLTPTAEVAFKFVNNGRRRSWEAKILRSPDGTTGTIFVEVEGAWVTQPTPQPYIAPVMPRPKPPSRPKPASSYLPGGATFPVFTPPPTPTPYPVASSWPTPSPSGTGGLVSAGAGNYAVRQADEEAEVEADPNEAPEPQWTPPPPPPFKVFGGEYPNLVTSVRVKLDLVPRGDKTLAFKLDGTFDEPELFPFFGSSFQVPTHWKFALSVPKLDFDWDSRLHLDPGKITFKLDGGMKVEGGEDGADTFKFSSRFDEAKKDVMFSLTHVDAKIKLLAEGKVGEQKPTRAVVLSTEDDSEIGVIEPNPNKPNVITIKMHEDGKVIEWQPLPSNFTPFGIGPQPGMAPPMPAPTAPKTARRPIAPS